MAINLDNITIDRIGWKDDPDTSTPLDSGNLKEMENNSEAGINTLKSNVQIALTELESKTTELESKTKELNTEIDNLKNYSKEEQVIGTWIDGKTLYRKVYSQSNRATINLTKLNYDYIHIVNSTLKVSNYIRNPYYTSSTDYFRVLITSAKILMAESSAESSSVSNWTTILEYTKTTD